MIRPRERPVRPRRRRVRMRPMGGLSINRMIPNMLTLLALCAGMTAIRFAIVGKFEQGVSAILIAGVLDGLDGRIARLLKSTSSFGAQLDSLSDFISFGVAPAFLLYIWTMETIGSLGWAIAWPGSIPSSDCLIRRPMPIISSPECRPRRQPACRCCRSSPVSSLATTSSIRPIWSRPPLR